MLPGPGSLIEDLKTVLQLAFPDARPVHFTEAGLCEKAKAQHRVRGTTTKIYYRISLNGGRAAPVKLM